MCLSALSYEKGEARFRMATCSPSYEISFMNLSI